MRMKAAGTALAMTLLAGTASAAGFDIFDLDEPQVDVSAMSDNGEIIVGRRFRSPDHPDVDAVQMRWAPWTGVMDIGGTSEGYGRPVVSADGEVVFGTLKGEDPDAFHEFHSAMWAPTMFSWTEWDPLAVFDVPPPPEGWGTETLGLSKNGLHLVGTTTDVNLWIPRAFHWTTENGQGYRLLDVLDDSDAYVIANAVSNDGSIVAGGNSRPPHGYIFAVRWIDGEIETIEDADGEPVGEVLGCNSDCSWMVGNSVGSSAANDVLAYRWSEDGGVQYLQPFDGAPTPARYAAAASTEDGAIVIGSYFFEVEKDGWFIGMQRGWIWFDDDNGGQMHDLADWVAGQGSDFFDGWDHNWAVAISSDGRYVAGSGRKDYAFRGWRMTLPQPDSIFRDGFEGGQD